MLESKLGKIETAVRDEIQKVSRENREELGKGLADTRKETIETLQKLTLSNTESLEKLTQKVEAKLEGLTQQAKVDGQAMREVLAKAMKEFSEVLDKNMQAFNEVQREKFSIMETRQIELVQKTEEKLEKVRETVDEKLQKTLNERIGQSFELVGKQLESVQQGLGEMKTLASDVGGLKKVLSNVKIRGGIGEQQLAMLLEQMLAAEQYEANVRTKHDSNDVVEFAVKLPGKEDMLNQVWLPIDAKFPKDAYEQLVDAYDTVDTALIDEASKNLENIIKKMAKDINDKYIDPPYTTDFGIMFLPFEGLFAEVTRRTALMEILRKDYRVIVTGPTTLAAILSSLQMGFRTLALQKRSSEVWKVLGAVKSEFEKFGGMLEKAQKNITAAGSTLDDLIGTRSRAIARRLKDVQSLPASESGLYLPEITDEAEEEDL
ncbi:MAG: DNA recombination protein RmuC [Flavobacteriaceae bacterium]|nr:DNA recombination protein RmuC [Flavobacteriaceae bacterium]